eukprot:TRINITY_DN53887_c0_g3_i1.p1 TRINITY_DN53887_c0_g3~~TRINITY_DN53887_c0_g3_i1.p1  ORF type:complete len:650 (-),score=81.18 TRINITY_DN53887_c0_g3_i1:203-2152(-)
MVPSFTVEGDARAAAAEESIHMNDVRLLSQAGAGGIVHAISREILLLHELLLKEHEQALLALAGGDVDMDPPDVMPLDLHDVEKSSRLSSKKLLDGARMPSSLDRCSTASDSQISQAAYDKSNPGLKKTSSTVFMEVEEQAREDARHLAAQLKVRTCERPSALPARQASRISLESKLPQGARQHWLVVKGTLRWLTDMPAFEVFFACAILANSIGVGVEVNSVLVDPHSGVSNSFAAMNYTFSFLFFLELLCRLGAHGSAFFCGSQWAWNSFDVIIVMASLVEIVSYRLGANTLGSGMGGRGARIIRILRVTRFIRILRVARLMRFVRALRQLLLSIICTLQEVVWAFVLLLIFIYIFAITFAQVVSFKAMESGQVPDDRLYVYWGTVPKSMWSLFMSISGGISWHVVVEPLEDVWPPLVLLFSFYVTFTVFAMLNVITGVFCESAIAAARADAEHVCQEHLMHKNQYMQNVKNVFDKIGQDGADAITFDDLEEFLSDPKAIGFFGALDIDISDVWTLFKLLDESESRIVNLEEFVSGCFRLKGSARSLDVALMGYEQKQFRRRVFRFMDSTHEMLEKLCHLQNQTNWGISSGDTSRMLAARFLEHRQERELPANAAAPQFPAQDTAVLQMPATEGPGRLMHAALSGTM